MSTWPRFTIVADLERHNEALCIRYLEHLIRACGDGDPGLHEKLAFLLLRRAECFAPDDEVRASTIATLLDHLETSQQYRPERILNRVPTSTEQAADLFDVRALLLGRLGQDEAALRIYVDRQGDDAKAEDYCRRIVARDPASHVFLTLLDIYLRPKRRASEEREKDERRGKEDVETTAAVQGIRLEPALGIIARHGARIDARAALELLPARVLLSSVDVFASKALRQTYARRAETLVLAQIAQERAVQAEEEQAALHHRRVKVTETRT